MVFCLLTSIYISLATEHDEHEADAQGPRRTAPRTRRRRRLTARASPARSHIRASAPLATPTKSD